MRFQHDFLICEDEGECFFARDGTKQVIPKPYEAIIEAMKSGVTQDTEIIGKLMQNGMPETEAALLCAEFIIEYSDVIQSEQQEEI